MNRGGKCHGKERRGSPIVASDAAAQSAVSTTTSSTSTGRAAAATPATGNRVAAPRLRSADELDRNWSAVVDVVDSLLERTDGVLDEIKAALKKGAKAVGGLVAEVCSGKSKGFTHVEGYGIAN